MQLSRRQLLHLSGLGCGALLGTRMHAALASLSVESRTKMLQAIPGKLGEEFRSAGYIGYHVTSQPANSPTFTYLQGMWEKVRIRSNGWLQVIMLPNSAEMPAADVESVLATATGRFDVITVAGPAIDGIMPQAIPLQALAFVYKDSTAARSFVNTELYAACMNDAAASNNLHCLDGLLNAGMRQMTTIHGHPLKSVQAFRDLVLRIPPGPIYSEQLSPLGIKPVMTPISDALKLMKTGDVMGQENPMNYAVLFSFYKVCRYLNETNHFWSGFNTLINADAWNHWPDSIKKIVQAEYTNILDGQWQAVENSNATATSFCLTNGMELIKTNLSGVREKLRATQIQIVDRLDARLQPVARSLINRQP